MPISRNTAICSSSVAGRASYSPQKGAPRYSLWDLKQLARQLPGSFVVQVSWGRLLRVSLDERIISGRKNRVKHGIYPMYADAAATGHIFPANFPGVSARCKCLERRFRACKKWDKSEHAAHESRTFLTIWTNNSENSTSLTESDTFSILGSEMGGRKNVAS